MPHNKVHIIINPVAGAGRTKRMMPSLKTALDVKFGGNYTIHQTSHPLEATRITRNQINDGARLIVTVGGDGTVQEVVNGFYTGKRLINPFCELGLVCLGTGMGLAQTLDLPVSIMDQIDMLLKPYYTPIDIGCVSYKNSNGETEERLFISECQVGIGSKVVSKVGKCHKRLGGKIAFGSVAVNQLLLHKSSRFSVKICDNNFSEHKLLGIVVGNGSYCAGGMRLTPEAKPDDGYFDVLLIHEMNMLNRMVNFSKVYSGKHIESKYFTMKRTKKILIESKTQTQIEADGELLGFTPNKIELLPAQLRVKSSLNYKTNGNGINYS